MLISNQRRGFVSHGRRIFNERALTVLVSTVKSVVFHHREKQFYVGYGLMERHLYAVIIPPPSQSGRHAVGGLRTDGYNS